MQPVLRRLDRGEQDGNSTFYPTRIIPISSGSEEPSLLEELENCYSRYGENETIVVSRSNKRANRFNQGIRNQILWREEEIAMNDLLMIVKNNYFWTSAPEKLDFIANGDIARIERIHRYQFPLWLPFRRSDSQLYRL